VLGDTLTARGAAIEYAECYRRGRPDADAGPLLEAWQARELHAITVTSSEGLRNLFAWSAGRRVAAARNAAVRPASAHRAGRARARLRQQLR
jgi:uroporphyrinogen-III synthase